MSKTSWARDLIEISCSGMWGESEGMALCLAAAWNKGRPGLIRTSCSNPDLKGSSGLRVWECILPRTRGAASGREPPENGCAFRSCVHARARKNQSQLGGDAARSVAAGKAFIPRIEHFFEHRAENPAFFKR